MQHDVTTDNITTLVDSRENLPYAFSGPTEVTGLAVGDYSVKGLENCITLERKTADDLIGSLTKGRDRFERELFKLKSYDYAALIIETSLADIINGNYYSDMNPKSVIQSLVAFSIRFRLPVWFAGSRAWGQRLTESLLCKYAAETEKRFKALSNT